MKFLRECDICGSEYPADTNELKRGHGTTCSKKCGGMLRESHKRSIHLEHKSMSKAKYKQELYIQKLESMEYGA